MILRILYLNLRWETCVSYVVGIGSKKTILYWIPHNASWSFCPKPLTFTGSVWESSESIMLGQQAETTHQFITAATSFIHQPPTTRRESCGENSLGPSQRVSSTWIRDQEVKSVLTTELSLLLEHCKWACSLTL